MTHFMHVLLIAILGVAPNGMPTVEYEVYKAYTRPQECEAKRQEMLQVTQGSPKINIQCVPVEHGMVL